jgi:predicted ferric reductase
VSWRVSAVVATLLVALSVAARLRQEPDLGTATWDISRAAGFATYLLLWASTLLGVAAHFRVRPRAIPLSLMLESHRICSTLAIAFVAGHVASLLLDPVVHFAPIDAVVPFTSSYRPLQVGAGTLAMWMAAVVLFSTAVAGQMPYPRWHAVHLLAYPCYVAALVHGITSGTDSASPLALAIYASTAAAVAAVAVARALGRGWVAAGEAPVAPR